MWQIPAFLLGLAALIGVAVYRPFGHPPDERRRFEEDLATVRNALDAKDPDTALALALGEDLLEQTARFPERGGEVRFLLGSAYSRRAEEVSAAQAYDVWTTAREHLENAEAANIPDADRPRLLHRLAQAWYHTGVDPQRVLDCLARTNEAAADSLSDHFAMLTQLYLNLPTPNLDAALEANARQIGLPTDNEDLLAPARLLRGQLLLRTHKADEARKVLARIQPGARPAIYATARLLRAQSLQQDHRWREALPLWEEIVHAQPAVDPETAKALFALGVCYRKLERADDAGRVWEQALRGDAETSQAAALYLAEARLSRADPTAVDYFERALANVAGPDAYRNSLIDLAEARRLVEQGCRAFHKAGDFGRAQRLVGLFEKLAPEGGRQLAGEVADGWGRDCLRRASQATGPEAIRLRAEAASHLRDAGAAYVAAAGALLSPVEQARWLWLGAARFQEAGTPAQAAIVLQHFLAVETDPKRLGEGWYRLAEIQRGQRDSEAARDAYHKCIELNVAPFAFRARYRLALADVEAARASQDAARLDDAEAALLQNLELMRSEPDPEAHEQTLRALANLLIQRGNYRMAVLRLQEVLARYPRAADSLETHQQLADCYWRLRLQEDQNLRAGLFKTPEAQLHYREQRGQWLQLAQVHYQKVTDDLMAGGAKRSLSPAENESLRHSGFANAECFFQQGMYAEAARWYETLAAWYAGRGEALKALREITRCYWTLNDRAKARATVQRLREALRQIPDNALGNKLDMPSRSEWTKWVEDAEKQ